MVSSLFYYFSRDIWLKISDISIFFYLERKWSSIVCVLAFSFKEIERFEFHLGNL